MDINKIKNPAALKALFEGDAENFAAATTPGGIVAQEARGQDRLVHSDLLPKELNGGFLGRQSADEAYQKLGIKILASTDDLFYSVELPYGWVKQGSDHNMWSYVLDEKGRTRISVFYKAAFYDRRAFVNIEPRFHGTYDPVGGWESHDTRNADAEFVAVVKDCNTIIWTSDPMKYSEMPTWDMSKLAQEWLDEHYPDWRDEFAYWE